MKKISLTKNPAPANRIDGMFLSETCSGTEFQEFSSIFFPRNRISSIFLLCGTVGDEIPRVFCSADGPEPNSESLQLFLFSVQNSKHFSPLQNGSEHNSESFLFRHTAGILPEQTNCSVYSVFQGIIFLLKIANPSLVTSRCSTGSFSLDTCRRRGGR
jgi:hypothetical protein